MKRRFTAIIQQEKGGFVALCPELDIASQGETVESARDNLREALELFFECASPAEIQERLGGEIFVTHVEVLNVPRDPLAPLRAAGLHPGAIQPAPDFDAPSPDDLWAS